MTDQVTRLFVVVTGCLCFLILTLGVLLLLYTGAFAQSDSTQISLGAFKASGFLGGLAFLALIALFIIRTGLRPHANPMDTIVNGETAGGVPPAEGGETNGT